MRSASADLRCKHCDALLAKHDRDGLTIRRGDMQTTVSGTDFSVSVTCYRCRTLNVLSHGRLVTPTVGNRATPA